VILLSAGVIGIGEDTNQGMVFTIESYCQGYKELIFLTAF
jgi:hypothetical protein